MYMSTMEKWERVVPRDSKVKNKTETNFLTKKNKKINLICRAKKNIPTHIYSDKNYYIAI